MSDDAPVLDIMPVLRARRRSTCEHINVSVDGALAHLECEECEQQINPYWWIERLVGRWSAEMGRIAEHEERARAETNRNITGMNHRIERLRLEIETLEAKKRQLQAEVVNGAPLGRQVKRWKRPQ